MIEILNVKIKDVCMFRYSIPFKEPLRVGKKRLKTREGLVVGLTDEEGLSGYGEIAPLAGFSRESAAEAEKQVLQVSGKLVGMSLIKEFALLSGNFSKLVSGLIPYPSVVFGVETAGVNLLQRRMQKAFPGSISANGRKIPVNGLVDHLTGQPDSIEKSVGGLLDKGFKTIKIKLGRGSLAEDIERINRAVGVLPGGVLLRLDANRQWDFSTAVEFGKGIKTNKAFIEYIEEPFGFEDPGQLGRFYQETGIPTALDETLQNMKPGDLEAPEGLAALIIKPTLLGGFDRISGFIDLARERRLKPIISSCFEVGPGFAELCKIKLIIDFDNSAAGLDTLKYLEGNLFLRPVAIEDGGIPVKNILDAAGLYNFDLLKRCPSGED
jgi:O-succinylbenzoate synthase